MVVAGDVRILGGGTTDCRASIEIRARTVAPQIQNSAAPRFVTAFRFVASEAVCQVRRCRTPAIFLEESLDARSNKELHKRRGSDRTTSATSPRIAVRCPLNLTSCRPAGRCSSL